MTKRSRKRLRNREEYDDAETEAELDEEELEEEEVTTLPKSKKKKRKRFPYFTFTVLGLVAAAVLLAPTIVSLTALGPNMVASAAKDQIRGTLNVQGVSLGWLSPLKLHGVTLKDQAGQPVATVKSITINKSILGLLGDMTRLDTITVEDPQLQLVVRADGSNLEDVLAPLMQKPATGGALPEFNLQVVNASLDMVDAARQKSWQFTPLSVQVASPRKESQQWLVHVEGKMQNAALLAHIQHNTSTEPPVAIPTTIELRTAEFPLESLRPILSRFAGDMQLQGLLSGKVDCALDGQGQPQQMLFENVEATAVHVAAPRYLGNDPLQVQHCKANGMAQFAQGVWQLKDLQVESDVAALAGNGDVRVSDFTSGNALPQTDCNVRGVVDIAKLVHMFPNQLKVREGVEIIAGRANVILVSHAAGAGRRFEASLTMENLQAKNRGQLVSLKEPVAMGAVVTQSAQGWKIEKLDAKSSFLTADVTGTPENGKLEVRGDLQRLKEELAQFFDLTGVKLAGSLEGDMQWQTAGAAINTRADIRFARLSVEMPNMLPWHEDALTISLQGEGIQPAAGSYAVATGTVNVESEQDKLHATLREPVRAISAQSPLPLSVKLTGNLATWLPRLQAFVPLAGWQVSGPIELTADANVSSARIEAPKCQIKIQQLHAAGNGMHIREPMVQGETRFVWDAATSNASLAQTMIQSTSLAIAADQMEFQTGDQAKIVGSTAVRGDLGKVLAWWNDPNLPPQMQCFGELEAEVKFTMENNTTRANLAGKIDKLAVAQRATVPMTNRLVREVAATSPWQTVWTEPQVIFGGEAAYNAANDTVTLSQMQTKAGTSIVSTSGTISQLTSSCLADLKGEVRYDLGSLTPLARPYLGDTFSIAGVTSKPFELHGPLFNTQPKVGPASLLPMGLTGKAGLNWESASWMSLEMGGAELASDIKNSTIFVQPTQIALSQGTVNLSPVVVLNGPQWYVAQEHVKLIDHVVITPQMCNQWIKYMAPLLVGATQAEGQFSVDLENAQIPVNQVSALNAKGTFTVHSVAVGPGPLAQQMIDVANKLKAFVDGKTGLDSLMALAPGGLGLGSLTGTPTEPAAATPEAPAKQWLELPEQNVPVDVVDGRVHHQGLAMQVKDVVIRTSGSVGIADQSLSLVAEIPILDDWIKNKKELAALKGQTIQIPVTGSVTKPQLDTRALMTFGKNFAFQAGRGMIDEQLKGGLEKGTSAVQSEVGKVQNKISEEMQKGKQKLESELRDGLKGIFGS
jgi:translocation and assembly module TamB